LRKALVGLAIVLAFGAAIVVGVFSLIGGSDACALAMAQARANQQVKERLGEPIEKGLFVSGNINTSGPSGHADLAIPVSGPKGKGKLYVMATKRMGIWKCDALQLAVEGDSSRIDVLAAPPNSAQP